MRRDGNKVISIARDIRTSMPRELCVCTTNKVKVSQHECFWLEIKLGFDGYPFSHLVPYGRQLDIPNLQVVQGLLENTQDHQLIAVCNIGAVPVRITEGQIIGVISWLDPPDESQEVALVELKTNPEPVSNEVQLTPAFLFFFFK